MDLQYIMSDWMTVSFNWKQVKLKSSHYCQQLFISESSVIVATEVGTVLCSWDVQSVATQTHPGASGWLCCKPNSRDASHDQDEQSARTLWSDTLRLEKLFSSICMFLQMSDLPLGVAVWVAHWVITQDVECPQCNRAAATILHTTKDEQPLGSASCLWKMNHFLWRSSFTSQAN